MGVDNQSSIDCLMRMGIDNLKVHHCSGSTFKSNGMVCCCFSLTAFMIITSGFIRVREMSGKFKFFQGQGIVKEFCDVSGKNEILQKCQGNVREFYILAWWSWDVWSRCIFFAKFIKFSAPILSGKFEFVSGKCQGIVREFWSVLHVWTLNLNPARHSHVDNLKGYYCSSNTLLKISFIIVTFKEGRMYCCCWVHLIISTTKYHRMDLFHTVEKSDLDSNQIWIHWNIVFFKLSRKLLLFASWEKMILRENRLGTILYDILHKCLHFLLHRTCTFYSIVLPKKKTYTLRKIFHFFLPFL